VELIGVNVGGTTTTVVRGDEDGNIHARATFATQPDRGADDLFARIAASVTALQTPASAAIGVAIGGPCDVRRGVVIGTPHLPFRDFPFTERLEAAAAIPVRLHHDAAACALAEWRFGPDRGVDGLAYLTCGTGFGVGLVLGGRPRYGTTGHSPEIGHVRYRDDGPEIFGKRGCFEGFGSATALMLLARERDPDDLGTQSPAQIADRAARGDRGALEILHENERAVGAACALLADLLVLDVIVLGSLARYIGPSWVDAVRETFASEALPANAARCQIRAAIVDVQDLSGLAAALEAVP
jgi:glucokinase